jgi:hypothetical protein
VVWQEGGHQCLSDIVGLVLVQPDGGQRMNEDIIDAAYEKLMELEAGAKAVRTMATIPRCGWPSATAIARGTGIHGQGSALFPFRSLARASISKDDAWPRRR